MWHVLALAIGGRTVAELQASMSRNEFLAWADFYRQWPFDDHHRYHRPAALISARAGRVDVQAELEWLEPPSPPEGMSRADFNTLRAFGIDPYSEDPI